MHIHTYNNPPKVNIMLDRDTISQQGDAPHGFQASLDDFMGCLERTKQVVENNCNGEFEHYKSCIERAMKILN
ncbi:MAG: hypothetical protein R6W73_08055 [Candidatus Saliniplasma sp.]